MVILSASILSSDLYQILVSDIGLYRAGSFGLYASLGKSIMVDSPSSGGTVLLVHMCSMSLWVISSAAFPPACNASAHMISGPGAVSFARFFITLLIVARLRAWVGNWLLCVSSGALLSAYMFYQNS